MTGTKSHHEHAVDCVTFMALVAPHRWDVVSDFFLDLNGTINFEARVDWSEPICFGSCGPPPDVAAMIREPISMADELADRMNVPACERKLFLWLCEAHRKARRLNTLRDTASEYVKTGSMDADRFTHDEMAKIKGMIEECERQKKKRLKDQKRRERQRAEDAMMATPEIVQESFTIANTPLLNTTWTLVPPY